MIEWETLMTAAEVGRVLRLRPRSVRALSLRNVLPPPIQIGRCLRWCPREIRAFMSLRLEIEVDPAELRPT